MILGAVLLLDQVLEDRLSRGDVGASGMNRAQVSRECRDVRIVLNRVVLQAFARKRARGPGLVEPMLEHRPLGNHRIQSSDYIAQHWYPSTSGAPLLRLY